MRNIDTRRFRRVFSPDRLDKPSVRVYNSRYRQGLVAQLGAHHIRIVGVGSSNLLKSTKKKDHQKGGFSFWYGIHAEEIRIIKYSADERCSLRHAAATHFLTKFLKSTKKKDHPKGGFSFWYGIHAEEIRTNIDSSLVARNLQSNHSVFLYLPIRKSYTIPLKSGASS